MSYSMENTEPPAEVQDQAAALRQAAALADRDADSEWPGSYYRKAHRARARRLRARADRLEDEARGTET